MKKHGKGYDTCLLPPDCEWTCEDIPKELPHYYSGRMLTARDMRDEQAFLLSRLRLRHRLFHGWGVVCGLEVCPHPDPNCRDHVIVKPGIAIDCCGNDIFVCDPCILKIPPLPDPDPCPPEDDDYGKEEDKRSDDDAPERSYEQRPDKDEKHTDPYKPDPHKPEPEWGPYVICLSYRRKGIEPRPVLDDDCGCDAKRTAPTRMRESFGLKVVPREELSDECWPGGKDGACGCGCKEAGAVDCFKPDCPFGDCLPLALLTHADGGLHIDTLGRPEVVTTLRQHTRISSINWPHGGLIAPEVLRDDMNGEFVVSFTAPLQKAETGTGISRFTFEITYSGIQNDVEFLPCEDEPYLSEDGCSAHYPIHGKLLDKIDRLSNRDIRVRLRGDFILDTHGRPIDADFLRGVMPTGNGTSGGTFESWVTTDR